MRPFTYTRAQLLQQGILIQIVRLISNDWSSKIPLHVETIVITLQ